VSQRNSPKASRYHEQHPCLVTAVNLVSGVSAVSGNTPHRTAVTIETYQMRTAPPKATPQFFFVFVNVASLRTCPRLVPPN